MPLLKLDNLVLRGTPAQMGMQHGEALRQQIQAFVPMRFEATLAYLAALGHGDVAPLVAVGNQCLQAYSQWDPAGYAEHCAIATAAGVDAVDLYTAANMTDMRDTLALSHTVPADAEGCSAALIPASWTRGGQAIAAQTWDLNPQDIDYVVAIRRIPLEGPQTWSVTCTGCLSLVGINSAGLAVGTTNIKTLGSKVGVGYMGILHKMLNSQTFTQAARVCASAPRAAAHTYWLADARRMSEWETTAASAVRRDVGDTPLARTNHCLIDDHQKHQAEMPSSSSQARLLRLNQRLCAVNSHDLASLQHIFADRSDGVDSINRFAEDDQGTATDSCFVAVPEEKTAWACRGSADRGQWMELNFEDI